MWLIISLVSLFQKMKFKVVSFIIIVLYYWFGFHSQNSLWSNLIIELGWWSYFLGSISLFLLHSIAIITNNVQSTPIVLLRDSFLWVVEIWISHSFSQPYRNPVELNLDFLAGNALQLLWISRKWLIHPPCPQGSLGDFCRCCYA